MAHNVFPNNTPAAIHGTNIMEGSSTSLPASNNLAVLPRTTTTSRSETSSLISLAQPRPGPARRNNDYIETPLRPPLPHPTSNKSLTGSTRSNHKILLPAATSGVRVADRQVSSRTNLSLVTVTTQPSSFKREDSINNKYPTAKSHHHLTSIKVGVHPHVPVAGTFKKLPEVNDSRLSNTSKSSRKTELTSSVHTENNGGSSTSQHLDTLICRECGHCTCEDCAKPRTLPSKWICNDKFLCSASSALDICTCLCCVKGVFYHVAKDYDVDSDVTCSDEPCSCSPDSSQRCLRWCCLGFMSLVLPCLCCYWPMKGCLHLFKKGYSGFRGHGCKCHVNNSQPEFNNLRQQANNRNLETKTMTTPKDKRLLGHSECC